jgi:DNA polymerase-3 subunit delta'
VSRCQTIRIPQIETPAIANALEKKYGQDAERAMQIAQVAEGNFREALLLTKGTEIDWQEEIRNWLNMILQNKTVEQVKWIDKLYGQGREYQKQLLKRFLHLIELSIRLYALGEESLHFAGRDRDFAIRMNKICGVEQLDALAKELDKSVYYVERNANGKMLFMALSIRIYHIVKQKAVLVLEGDKGL